MCQPAPSTPRCSRPLNAKEAWTPKTFATAINTKWHIFGHAHPNGSTATLCVSNAWTSSIWHQSPRGRRPIHAELITVVCDPSSPLLHISTFEKSLPQACLGQTRTPRVTSNATSVLAGTPTMTPFTLSQPPEVIWPHCAHVSSPAFLFFSRHLLDKRCDQSASW